MQCKQLSAELAVEMTHLENLGEVANYIPELSRVDPDKFGLHLINLAPQRFSLGDAEERFSIQSISKVLALTLAFQLEGEKLFERVGVEPSGTAFNSLVLLEYEHGIPRNPLINAGALVVCDLLLTRLPDPRQTMLDLIAELVGTTAVGLNATVAQSEQQTGFTNAAVVNLLKAYGNIHNPIEQVLELYYAFCALEMNCQELAQAFLYLANNGINPLNGKTILSASKTKRVNAIMQLCGFYDEAGEFAFKVGLPGKSGVGGGIIAVHPESYSVAVWSPRLNSKGNSYRGMKILEFLTTRTQSSIF